MPRDDGSRGPIAGRTALVTGAGDGLGRAISQALRDAGCRVILVGRHREKLFAVAGEDHAYRVAGCDVSDPWAVEALLAELARENVSILINNAGIAGPVAEIAEVTPAEWDEVFAVNVRGVYLMCRAFVPPMVRRGCGDVINIASVSGKRPLAGRTPYTASKMAVIGLTATLAHEVGPAGVAVNSISPGAVRGPRMERNFRRKAGRRRISYPDAEREFVSRTALRRMLDAEEVGAAVIAVLNMSGLTGADIDLSAGMVAR